MLGDPFALTRHRKAPSASQYGPAFSPLVLLQDAPQIPFFCVHGAGGNVLNFRDLVQALGPGACFYGLQAHGVDGARALGSVEEMAELYLREVERVHPEGPYRFGGYSGGGLIAFEMAQQLIARNKTVDLLALFDTYPADVVPQRTSKGNHAKALLARGPAYLAERVRAVVSRKVDAMSHQARVQFYLEQGLPLPIELREQYLTSTFLEVSEKYRPRPYPGKVLLYRAREQNDSFKHLDAKLGWDRYVENLEVVQVDGDHDNFVYAPQVQTIANHLGALMRSPASPA